MLSGNFFYLGEEISGFMVDTGSCFSDSLVADIADEAATTSWAHQARVFAVIIVGIVVEYRKR